MVIILYYSQNSYENISSQNCAVCQTKNLGMYYCTKRIAQCPEINPDEMKEEEMLTNMSYYTNKYRCERRDPCLR